MKKILDVTSLDRLEQASVHHFLYDLKDQLQRAVYARSETAFAAGDAARDAIRTRAALRRRQEWVRTTLIKALGGLPPLDTPLHVTTAGRISESGFDIEKLIYQTRPGTPVTGNLYLPHGLTKPRGAVLFLCGHASEAKHSEVYQTVCRHLVQAGLIVLAQDPVGQGERLSYYEPGLAAATVPGCTTEHDLAGGQCLLLGDALARYFLHDAMRGIDVLCSRPEVDPRRIGVTGSSGGGTQTSLMMLADPRVSAAAPGTFVMNRRTYMYSGQAQDAEQHWPGLTAQGIDHEDILLAMCPKPVCVLACRYDFFPIEGTRTTVQRSRRFWSLFDREPNLELVEAQSTHAYTPFLASAAARFFSRHLLGKAVEVRSAGIKAAPGSSLWCTTSGQVRADFPRGRVVYDENQDRLKALEQRRREMSEARRRQRALAWLKGRIVRSRPRTDVNLRCYAGNYRAGELIVDHGAWWSHPGIMNEGLLFRHFRDDARVVPVTVAVWDGGTAALRRHWNWLRATCDAGRAVLVLDVSGVAGGEPNLPNARPAQDLYGILRKLNDDLLWLDDSLCAMRAWDVRRARAALAEWPGVTPRDLRVYACGRQGLYAELAAAVDPALAQIEVHEPMMAYADWVRARHYEQAGCRELILPGLLAYADLPDLRRWRKHLRKEKKTR